MAEAVLLVGTKKGLWIGRSKESRRSWTWSEPEFLMQGIYATCIDTRGGVTRMFVGGTSEHSGRASTAPTTSATPGSRPTGRR